MSPIQSPSQTQARGPGGIRGFPGRCIDLLRLRRPVVVTTVVGAAILLSLVLRHGLGFGPGVYDLPLFVALAGGIPSLLDMLRKLSGGGVGADLLGGISVLTSIALGEYLAGSIIVLMLAGGAALEGFALRKASSALLALAGRMPSVAHRKGDGGIVDVPQRDVQVGDLLEIYPHEICPIDGIVVTGHGTMDESYLTGEPFQITKTSGSEVLSGAVNGESALTVRTSRPVADSRYSRILEVMKDTEAKRPGIRRLGDRLGAFYTPVALTVAVAAWLIGGDPVLFLSVLVIATPCPLLLAIPIAVIGSVSRCAQRAIIVKDPAALEQAVACRTAIFDKTGTLTHGEPVLTGQSVATGFVKEEVLGLAAGLERYSKHPLAGAILRAAAEAFLQAPQAVGIAERPGEGLLGTVSGHEVRITSRAALARHQVEVAPDIPSSDGGLECAVVVDGRHAALYRFHDAPRAESRSLVGHLGPRHQFARVMIVSGDRESEVRYLAREVGIDEIHAERSPEQKLEIVRLETARAKTLYVGDGINDAPAMLAATVGIALGHDTDVAAAAAGVVIMDDSLAKVDEFLHISRRMRSIALQSAVGGMALSVIGMGFAATGHLGPVGGAVAQEIIDVLAVLNALRAAFPPRVTHDF